MTQTAQTVDSKFYEELGKRLPDLEKNGFPISPSDPEFRKKLNELQELAIHVMDLKYTPSLGTEINNKWNLCGNVVAKLMGQLMWKEGCLWASTEDKVVGDEFGRLISDAYMNLESQNYQKRQAYRDKTKAAHDIKRYERSLPPSTPSSSQVYGTGQQLASKDGR